MWLDKCKNNVCWDEAVYAIDIDEWAECAWLPAEEQS